MLQSILDGVAQTPHEFELVFFQDGPWAAELARAGFRVEVIPSGRFREAHRWLLTVARLAKLLRKRRPDVVLNWSAKTQLYGSPAAVLSGMPKRVVWWQQGIPEPDFWLDRLATRLPAAAVGCYSHAAARAQAQLPPGRPTVVIPAGAGEPPSEEPPAAIDLPANVPVVGVVGRLQPWKGQDRVLRAQALLRDRGHRLHLVIVGGDAYGLSSDYAASLEPLARELGLAQDVTMTGQVPDAGPFIERMDVMVNASDPEPFGIVLLEAMARGVAVLAVDSGGPAEFIRDGVSGCLARSGEPADLADALERLLDDATLRSRVAAAGRESYRREFTERALRERFFAALQCTRSPRESGSSAG
jgi:glycosyltransferase involved in cell wall biosynthesis